MSCRVLVKRRVWRWQKCVKSTMSLPFLPFISYNSSCEGRGGEKKEENTTIISCLDWFKQYSLPGLWRVWQIFSLTIFLWAWMLSPWKCLVPALWCAGMLWTSGGVYLSFTLCSRPGHTQAPMGADSRWRGHLPEHHRARGSTWLTVEVSQPALSRPWPVWAGRSNEITAGAGGDMAPGHHLT